MLTISEITYIHIVYCLQASDLIASFLSSKHCKTYQNSAAEPSEA